MTIINELRKSRAKARLRFFQLRYKTGPYAKLSEDDARTFASVLDAWRPESGGSVTMVRWLVSEWCNYACPYCPQVHTRYRKLKNGMTSHAFDNFPVESWNEAFSRHFKDRAFSITITGGEPMLDRVAMPKLLEHLVTMDTCEVVRIDTNASWGVRHFEHLPKDRIELMCTFHPSRAKRDSFLARLQTYQAAGFRIEMVNYVMSQDNFDGFLPLCEDLAELGIPANPNPLWGGPNHYAPEQIAALRAWLPKEDFAFRSGTVSPKGRKCLFPALAYEMNQTGAVKVGCHPGTRTSFFDEKLPRLFAGPVPCPYTACVCVDKYSFLQDVNRNDTLSPIAVYADLLRERAPLAPGQTR